jgi:choline dehydrogenase-like flavoprotein
VQLDKMERLNFSIEDNPDKKILMNKAKSVLSYSFRQMGGFLLPRGFKEGGPGSDIHYSGTLPMNENPRSGETTPLGEIPMLKGVHVIDGSCLPFLLEKPHTLTIMANADRIAKKIISQLCS